MGEKSSDFIFLHPPSVYDWRKLFKVLGPISDLVPSTPVFELYPIGITFLAEYLTRNGFESRIINIANMMLKKSSFDPESYISKLNTSAFGIDLHWLPHAHGSIEIARLTKKLHPQIPVILGGYTASYFADEILRDYPEVDFILRGDSTEEPTRLLLDFIINGRGQLDSIPNLSYRDGSRIAHNEYAFIPGSFEYLGFNYLFMLKSVIKYRSISPILPTNDWWKYPITMVLTVKGCDINCNFCGGSKYCMDRNYGRSKAAFRSPERIARDVEIISSFTTAPIFVVGDLMQGGREYAEKTLELISHIAPKNQIVFELFNPAPKSYFTKIAASIPHFNFEISPESHDELVRSACGKKYSNFEMEENIGWALEQGCEKFDVFFMIGLPGQSTENVMETVEYCGALMKRYGPRINPLIGPLAPFIDPGSVFYDMSEEFGYEILCKSFDDYRRALLNPSWKDVLGYQTRWMSRDDIAEITYAALLELNRLKGKHGHITPKKMNDIDYHVRASIALTKRIEEISRLESESDRLNELTNLADEADRLNRKMINLKDDIKWPINGFKFHYLNILKLLIGKK